MGGRYGKPGSRTTLPYEVRRQYTDACERGSHNDLSLIHI